MKYLNSLNHFQSSYVALSLMMPHFLVQLLLYHVLNISLYAVFHRYLLHLIKNTFERMELTMKQSTINFSSLTKDLILATATKRTKLFSRRIILRLNCLLRSFHSTLQETTLHPENKDTEYIQNQFCSAYKIITGKTIYPFQ